MDGQHDYGDVPERCTGTSRGRHSWRWMRTLVGRGPSSTQRRCRQPKVLVCDGCLRQCLGNCESHDSRVCPSCAKRYEMLVRKVVTEPMTSAAPGTLWLWTITAPGALTSGHGETSVQQWNESLSLRWNRFIEELKRSIPGLGGLEYIKIAEQQDRDALHLHIVLRTKRRIILSRAMLTHIRRLATHFEFGRQIDFQRVGDAAADRKQVASYITKNVAQTPVQVGSREDEARPKRIRVWTASRKWGKTLAQTAAQSVERFASMLRRALGPSVDPRSVVTQEPSPPS